MTWVRLDDGFAEHPKIVRAGPLAAALQVAALCYCSRNLTNGEVPSPVARRLLDIAKPQQAIAALVREGIWEEGPDGYRIHDFLDYQPSRDEVRSARTELSAKRRDAGRKGAVARWQNDGQMMANGMATPSQNHGPDPTRIQTPKTKSKDLPSAAPIGDFAKWWELYPPRNGKRLDKGKCQAAWLRLPDRVHQEALVGVVHYREACDEGLTIAKDPLRWLQGKCWTDWQTPATPSPDVATKPQGAGNGSVTNGQQHRNGFDLATTRSKLAGFLAAHVVAEVEGSLADSGEVTARRLVAVCKARARGMSPPIHIPEIEEL